jgi:hypothetical protein
MASTYFLAASSGGRGSRFAGLPSYQPKYAWYTAFALWRTVP